MSQDITRRAALLGGTAALAVPLLATGTHQAEAQSPAGVIVMAKQIDDITSLDPAEAFEYSGSEIIGNVYRKLVTTPNSDPARIVGDLAEAWETSDNRSFAFRLKPGQKFASGQPVTAEDAAFSLRRAAVLNKAPAFIINQFGFTKDNAEQRIRAADPQTLIIECAEATSPSFLYYCLSAAVGSVVEKAAVMARAQGEDFGNGWLKQNSAGGGAYVLRGWRASESVMLDANPNADPQPRTRRMVIRHMPDGSAQLLGLQRGDVDIARNLGADQITQLRSDSRYTVLPSRKANLLYLSLSQRHPMLAKPEVRQAIKWAIDYEGIQRNIVANIYDVHQAFLPEGLPGALTDKPFSQRQEEARRLLQAAGAAGGFELSFDYPSAPPQSDIAQAVQANLASVGIRLRMLPAEQRQVITKTRARQHEMALLRWGSDYFDPHSNAEAFSMNPDNGDNARNRTLAWRASWEIPQLTEQTAAAVRDTDAARRVATYLALQREHQQVSPFVILLQEIEVAVMRTSVTGLDLGPMNDRNRYSGIAKG
ncbi:ABC transporter substrate-binding protein [Falsiroseomonas sp. HW251]|uniref:ABC transporter substrate-binding protein n=1 Tax=Falsiroseomonas sp. HW251 TaxID=3390998 RepID=UPI003D322AD2